MATTSFSQQKSPIEAVMLKRFHLHPTDHHAEIPHPYDPSLGYDTERWLSKHGQNLLAHHRFW
jgi:hypothetical protein